MASVAHMSSDGTKMKIGKALPLLSKFISQIYKQKKTYIHQKNLNIVVLPSVANILKNLERNGNAKALTIKE